jgi:hypothetical protein
MSLDGNDFRYEDRKRTPRAAFGPLTPAMQTVLDNLSASEYRPISELWLGLFNQSAAGPPLYHLIKRGLAEKHPRQQMWRRTA